MAEATPMGEATNGAVERGPKDKEQLSWQASGTENHQQKELEHSYSKDSSWK